MPVPSNVRAEFAEALDDYIDELQSVFADEARPRRRVPRSKMTAAEKSRLIRQLGKEGYDKIPWT